MTLNHTTITYLMSDALQTELQKKKEELLKEKSQRYKLSNNHYSNFRKDLESSWHIKSSH